MNTTTIQSKTSALILIVLFFLIAVITSGLKAQHTFSIVAVDTITGEVGGAGATCYAVVNDIADVHPGVGFIHTQSYVDYNNQAYARSLMNQGLLPQQIMDSLVAHDATNQPGLRQYAAVSLAGSQKSAAFTGTNCFNYKGQRLGANYAIAGNILLGAQILDSMEARFLNTQGTLADKLMAAMQGAKVIGADSRCADDGVSSLSAYMIVAKPSDVSPSFYLNLNVENVHPADPIDSLQFQYDQFLQTIGLKSIDAEKDIKLMPNPTDGDYIYLSAPIELSKIEIINTAAETVVYKRPAGSKTEITVGSLNPGFYLCKITDKMNNTYFKKLIIE